MNEETEPDYDNDLALEYGVSWDLMRRIVYRPAFQKRSYPSRRVVVPWINITFLWVY